ncbi:hypothetical protein Hanom_Chr06g00536521 [Helianthus anomalus]
MGNELGEIIDLPENYEENMEEWNRRTISMEAKSMEVLCRSKVLLRDVCPHTMEVRYAGGMRILVTMGSQMATEELLTENKETFNRVGERLGKVIREAQVGREDSNLTSVHMGVIVKTGKVINRELVLWNKATSFKCWVSEVSGNWAPKFVENESVFFNIPDDISSDEVEEKIHPHDDSQEVNRGFSTVPQFNSGVNEGPATGEVGPENMNEQENESLGGDSGNNANDTNLVGIGEKFLRGAWETKRHQRCKNRCKMEHLILVLMILQVGPEIHSLSNRQPEVRKATTVMGLDQMEKK